MKRFLCLLAASAAVGATPGPAFAWQDPAVPPREMGASAPRADDTTPGDQADSPGLLGGGRFRGARLDAAIRKASAHPLGSKDNPVRVSMPQGQHAYLRRLRCSDDKAPSFERVGNFGPGVFGSIIDGYQVICGGGAEPARSLIYMDMYHPDHDETAAPPGFTFKARARQP